MSKPVAFLRSYCHLRCVSRLGAIVPQGGRSCCVRQRSRYWPLHLLAWLRQRWRWLAAAVVAAEATAAAAEVAWAEAMAAALAVAGFVAAAFVAAASLAALAAAFPGAGFGRFP